MKLEGRVALVTGAGRGFGRAIALALAHAGADVAINYRASATAAAEVVGEIEGLGRRALGVQADVSREDEVQALMQAVQRQLGRLDVLVNNAGI
ncbi:MAG: SDR family NAD(P)-dependent oxidoreductase, partial [Candidatus Rokuibacteriota bacterium]